MARDTIRQQVTGQQIIDAEPYLHVMKELAPDVSFREGFEVRLDAYHYYVQDPQGQIVLLSKYATPQMLADVMEIMKTVE